MNDRLRDPALAAPQASELLGLYQPGAHFFASPQRSLLTQGCRVAFEHQGGGDALWRGAEALLADLRDQVQTRPLLVGAIPFAADAPVRLVAPEGLVWGQGTRGMQALRQADVAPQPTAIGTVTLTPSPADYQAHVAHAVRRFETGGLEKVVLSRCLDVQARIDVARLMRRLAAGNQQGYTFAIDLPGADAGHHRTLVGASPELLIARYGEHLVSHPLAGSIPRSADPVEDQRRAQALLRSAKDHREHALVVDAVAGALQQLCKELDVPRQPALVATPTMWHLGTRISGTVADPAISALRLALALHPTPAVCGHPAHAAREFIEQVEGFDRGLFTGLVGWCDGDGDGEWAVTIRCAEVSDDAARLYAGAGIVAGSQPDLELAETTAKLRTMLRAMGLESVLGAQT